MLAGCQLACDACGNVLQVNIGTVSPAWLAVIRLQNLMNVRIQFLRAVLIFGYQQLVVAYVAGIAGPLVSGQDAELSRLYIH